MFIRRVGAERWCTGKERLWVRHSGGVEEKGGDKEDTVMLMTM